MRAYLTSSTPRPNRTRAEALFQSIEPHLNVNEKGEIIKDDNTVINDNTVILFNMLYATVVVT